MAINSNEFTGLPSSTSHTVVPSVINYKSVEDADPFALTLLILAIGFGFIAFVSNKNDKVG